MHFRSTYKKGFSLIELVISLSVMLILVGIAGYFFDDYVYKSKVAKVQQDLDMFADALNLYDAVENSPFKAYNYNSDGQPNGFFSWYAANVATSADYWSTLNGASTAWNDYSKNSLTSLVGTYLKTVPRDPWGSQYILNTAAGYIASMGADMKTSPRGDTYGLTEYGHERDIVRYYLGEPLMLVKVEINDLNNNNELNAGEFIDFTFNKDVQYNSDAGCFFYGDNEASSGTSNLGSVNVVAVRVANNGRIIRITATATIPLSEFKGKWFRMQVIDPYSVIDPNAIIYDMDQTCNASGIANKFGKRVMEANNTPRQAILKIY